LHSARKQQVLRNSNLASAADLGAKGGKQLTIRRVLAPKEEKENEQPGF
jgi:hypothetical protein